MATAIQDTTTVPDVLLELLKKHLPHSLPLLRRLQFSCNFAGGTSPSAHVLFTSTGGNESPDAEPAHFLAAYVDLSFRPQTAMWLYSSAEQPGRTADASDDALLLALFRHIRALEAADHTDTRESGTGRALAKIGCIAEPIRQRVLGLGLRLERSDSATPGLDFELCDHWLFRVDELPVTVKDELPDGWVWDAVRREDCEVVRARTLVNRTTETLLTFPGLVARTPDGTPAAWCFLGFEGGLSSLHVEDPYRGKGLAKAIACRLMRQYVQEFGDDGWAGADVFIENKQSQGVCKSIGGKKGWPTSWSIIDLDSVQ